MDFLQHNAFTRWSARLGMLFLALWTAFAPGMHLFSANHGVEQILGAAFVQSSHFANDNAALHSWSECSAAPNELLSEDSAPCMDAVHSAFAHRDAPRGLSALPLWTRLPWVLQEKLPQQKVQKENILRWAPKTSPPKATVNFIAEI